MQHSLLMTVMTRTGYAALLGVALLLVIMQPNLCECVNDLALAVQLGLGLVSPLGILPCRSDFDSKHNPNPERNPNWYLDDTSKDELPEHEE